MVDVVEGRGGSSKVGNLAGSQACPLGLLMSSFPGHTSAHLGCENRGKGGNKEGTEKSGH